MELYCPECMSAMASQDGRTAVCPAHGASFEILFARYPVAAPAVKQYPAGAAIPTASRMPSMPSGGIMSDPGYGRGNSDAYAANLTAAFGGPPQIQADCIKHPGVPAVVRCHSCGSAICSTCDFALPGGIHLCPKCAANPQPKVSSKRKGLIGWSVGLAIESILGTVVMFLMARNATTLRDAEAIGQIGTFLTLYPAIVGAALGGASFDRRLKTPGIAWFGLIGNAAVVLIWLLLIIVGLTK